MRREDAVGRDSAGRETRRGLFGCDSAYDLQIKEEVREVHTEHRQRGAHRIAAVQYTRKMLALTDRVHLTARYEAEVKRFDALPHLVPCKAVHLEIAPLQIVQLSA